MKNCVIPAQLQTNRPATRLITSDFVTNQSDVSLNVGPLLAPTPACPTGTIFEHDALR